MAFDSTKLQLGTRGALPDFVIFEETSPLRRSRSSVPAKAGSTIKPGDLVDATGAKVTAVADVAKVAGIALTAYSDGLFAGLTREGDIKIAIVAKEAEVKDTIFANNGVAKADIAAFAAQLAKANITVVACGL